MICLKIPCLFLRVSEIIILFWIKLQYWMIFMGHRVEHSNAMIRTKAKELRDNL